MDNSAARFANYLARDDCQTTLMDEHVIIVGSNSPLAIEASKAFLARGEKVSLISRCASELAEELGRNDKVASYSLDLTNLDGITDLYNEIVAKTGPVRRICFFQRYRDGADNEWDGEYAISLRATNKFIEQFRAEASSALDRSVVIVSSPADTGVVMEQPVSYHAIKAGLSQITRYYAVMLGKSGIRVNGVKPALVLKPRAKQFYDQNPDLVKLFDRVIPLGRMGWPSEIANAILFLSSDLASYITGQILCVDGGISLHESASLARVAASVFNLDLEDPRW